MVVGPQKSLLGGMVLLHNTVYLDHKEASFGLLLVGGDLSSVVGI